MSLIDRKEFLNSRAYWLLFATLLGLTIFGASYQQRKVSSSPIFLIEPKSQTAQLIVENLDLEFDIGEVWPESSKQGLAGPFKLEVGPQENIFLVDEGNSERITEFSPEGQLINTLFPEVAPEPYVAVSDISVGQDRVLIADVLSDLVLDYGRRSGAWTATKVREAEAYRVLPSSSSRSRYLLMQLGGPEIFALIDSGGEVLETFGVLFENQDYHTLLTDGFVKKMDDSILYAGNRFGIIGSFSERGKVEFLVETINPPAAPRTIDEDGTRRVGAGRHRAALSLALSSELNQLFVLSRRTTGLTVPTFIDIYRSDTGSYCKSLTLPGPFRWESAAVSADALYASHESGVVVWNGVPRCGESKTEERPKGRHLFSISTIAKPGG